MLLRVKGYGTVTGKLTDATGRSIGVETRLQQPTAVYEHYPLGIRLVRFLARDVLRIGQQDIKTFLLKEETHDYPVGTCGIATVVMPQVFSQEAIFS